MDASGVAGWIVGSMRCGVVAIDTRGRLTLLNSEARRILDCADPGPDGDLGRDCRELLAARPQVPRILREALDGRERPGRAELVLRVRGGGRGPSIGFTVVAVRDSAGAVRGSVLFFRELAAFEPQQERDHLRDRLEALGRMATVLAHEIRSPLAAMEVLLGMLKRSAAGRSEDLSLVEDLGGELRRVAHLVGQGLDFVRPTTPARRPVDLIAIAESALEQARSRVPFLGEVVRRYDPRMGRLDVDPDQMLALFNNLIGNALEAMAESPARGAGRLVLGLSIRQEAASRPTPGPGGDSILGEALGVAAGQRELVIAVEDSGPGVPEPLRQRIFDPFFTTKECGTGVGLAAVQKIALSHGGSIELDSPPGGGARFRVRLPDPAGRVDTDLS